MLSESTCLLLLAGSLSPVAYSYVIYPLLVAVLARSRAARPAATTPGVPGDRVDAPHVTLVVAAHNEAEVIAERIRNALDTDYPADRLEVLIASDGSTDGTNEIVSGCDDPRVRLLQHQPNRGKSWTINRAIPQATGSIVVMSDANTAFARDAITRLVARLEGPDRPLAVCGKLVLVDPESGDNADGLYWRYESWQKESEGRLAATLGANGGIYAFRRDDYCAIPDNTIIDDMTIPLLMKLEHGGDIVFEAKAVAREDAAPSLADEFGRRVRIGIGAFQSLRLLYPLLHPRHGFTAVAFLSHKLLRWFTPHLLVLAMVVTVLGLRWPSMRLAALAFLVFAAMTWAGRRMRGTGILARLFRLAAMFASMNTALLIGFLRWLREEQTGTWKRTLR